MNTVDIRINMGSEDIKHIIKRYHFREEDFLSLQALSGSMAPLLQVKAYYLWKSGDSLIPQKDYAAVFLTLGSGVDEMQEIYLSKNCLSEAYMIECIAIEMLYKSYGELIREVQRQTGKWVEKMEFLGDTYPIELLPKLYREFGQMDISYNEKFVLSPGKSVVFLLTMSDEKREGDCSLCESCGNKTCILRLVTD